MKLKPLHLLLAMALVATASFLAGRSTRYAAPEAVLEAGLQTGSAPSRPLPGRERETRRLRPAGDFQKVSGPLQNMEHWLNHFARIGPGQFEEEAKKLASIPMPERTMALDILFAKWAETDPIRALDHAEKIYYGSARSIILKSWASADPANAAKFYSENSARFASKLAYGITRGTGPHFHIGNEPASIIASEWARQNPHDAMAWAGKLSGREKLNALESIMERVASSDPLKAAAMATTLTGDEQSITHDRIAITLTKQSWSETEKFISRLPAHQQEKTRMQAFNALAKHDLAAAIGELAGFSEGEQRNQATTAVVNFMSQRDPAAALSLAMSSLADVPNDSMAFVMYSYARQDNAGALKAIQAIPEGTTRDKAIGAYVSNNQHSNYAESHALAQTITDSKLRTLAMRDSVAKWFSGDPEIAVGEMEQMTFLSGPQKNLIFKKAWSNASDEMKQRMQRSFARIVDEKEN